ncbi:hypothetical protein PsorP6_011735 [Peronosclerospora sorghi]|uniref:Uncharacterized protein n=1 Tax=Peronosclerospora sorghi TaxID=230839 RepID=A0ACC0WLB2_9STRA|nr:hypothetical protein PsorP6_011735 [Peronosclerospora sorghi]
MRGFSKIFWSPSYFFKMSKYQDRLVKHIEENPEFLQPEVRRQELLCRLKDPLQDFSASCNTFTHGIHLLNNPENDLYVWLDAIADYLSAIGYPTGPNARYWSANGSFKSSDETSLPNVQVEYVSADLSQDLHMNRRFERQTPVRQAIPSFPTHV